MTTYQKLVEEASRVRTPEKLKKIVEGVDRLQLQVARQLNLLKELRESLLLEFIGKREEAAELRYRASVVQGEMGRTFARRFAVLLREAEAALGVRTPTEEESLY